VGRSAGDQDGGASAGFDDFIAAADLQGSFKDVPGFVIAVVEMERGLRLRLGAGRGAGSGPFCDDKTIAGGTEGIAGKGRSANGFCQENLAAGVDDAETGYGPR
jgi:hypothetical protein